MTRKYSTDINRAVYYKVYLGGKALSAYENNLVEEIVFEDTSTGSDLCSITIHDPDYHIIGDKRLLKNTTCKVIAGWKNSYWTWIDGYVSAIDVDFPEEGYPMITIHVMDRSYIMNKIERKRVYKNMSYYAIAKDIAKRYGFSFDGDTSGDAGKKQESVSQSYETDIQFIQGLADEIGFMVWVDAKKKLHFKDREKYLSHKPYATLWYKKAPFDIINFRPRIIEADQPDEIESSDIDNKDKKKTKATAKKK